MKVRTTPRSGSVVVEMEAKDSTLPPISVPELRLKQILVPVDFSDCSHKAFHYAIHFARQFNAELLLLHIIVSVPPPPQMPVYPGEELSAKYYEDTAKQLSEWRNETGAKLRVKAVTRVGTSAHQEILDAARESNSDLIIMGHHGRTGLSRMLLGSTAERVVRHAPCPVLVIRECEHDFVQESAWEAQARS